MCTPITAGVDDNFPACQPHIALRTTNEEHAREVDLQVCVVTVQCTCCTFLMRLFISSKLGAVQSGPKYSAHSSAHQSECIPRRVAME